MEHRRHSHPVVSKIGDTGRKQERQHADNATGTGHGDNTGSNPVPPTIHDTGTNSKQHAKRGKRPRCPRGAAEEHAQPKKRRAISSARLWRRRLYTCALSTSSSLTALKKRNPHLADGFALRCVQRLSRAGAATRLCPWRDNRQTGGLPSTVLSY